MPRTHTHKAVSCTQGHGGFTHDNIEKIYIIYSTPRAPVPPPSPTSQPQTGHGGRGRTVEPQDFKGRRGKRTTKGENLEKWRSRDPQSEMEVEVRRWEEQQGRPSCRCQGAQPPHRTAERTGGVS